MHLIFWETALWYEYSCLETTVGGGGQAGGHTNWAGQGRDRGMGSSKRSSKKTTEQNDDDSRLRKTSTIPRHCRSPMI